MRKLTLCKPVMKRMTSSTHFSSGNKDNPEARQEVEKFDHTETPEEVLEDDEFVEIFVDDLQQAYDIIRLKRVSDTLPFDVYRQDVDITYTDKVQQSDDHSRYSIGMQTDLTGNRILKNTIIHSQNDHTSGGFIAF